MVRILLISHFLGSGCSVLFCFVCYIQTTMNFYVLLAGLELAASWVGSAALGSTLQVGPQSLWTSGSLGRAFLMEHHERVLRGHTQLSRPSESPCYYFFVQSRAHSQAQGQCRGGGFSASPALQGHVAEWGEEK